jgi:hypothetical protein
LSAFAPQVAHNLADAVEGFFTAAPIALSAPTSGDTRAVLAVLDEALANGDGQLHFNII